jgi:hypothetical protein
MRRLFGVFVEEMSGYLMPDAAAGRVKVNAMGLGKLLDLLVFGEVL